MGHSAGSMIVRTALASPVLKPYPEAARFFFIVVPLRQHVRAFTLIRAHVGLQHLHQSQFMDELQLLDAPKPEDAFMHRSRSSPASEI